MKSIGNRPRQCFDEIKDGFEKRKAGHEGVHTAVMAKEVSEKAEKNQRDGKRIQEHQNRNGICNDRGQAEVGNDKGNHTENDRPDLIAEQLREQLAEGFRAAGDKADGRF